MELKKLSLLVASIWILASCVKGIQDTSSDLQAQLRYMAQQLQHCEGDAPSDTFDMRLHYITDANTTCNDGTPAGYYLKLAPGSKRWLVFLQGGWFCHNRASCNQRASGMRRLMTSKYWSSINRGSGMLSPQPEENPSWWNANHVLVPYCSSDAWSGNASNLDTGEKFSFLGSRIIDKVIEDLLPRGLFHAKHLLLAGSSAGGIGVIMNLDRISQKLQSLGSTVQVRGLADSGWYLSDSPSRPACPKGEKTCGPVKTIKEGMKYWNGVVPENCSKQHASEPWKCYFGEVVYPSVKTPLFIFQWLYDEAQLALDGVTRDPKKMSLKQVKNIFKMAEKLRESFKRARVRNVFSPACLAHTILTHNNWMKTRIKSASLSQALDCWYRSSGHNHGHGKRKSLVRQHKPGHCPTHLVDQCFYPLCNPTCSIPRDPYGKPYPIKLPGQIPGIPLSPMNNPSSANIPRLKP